MPPLLSVEGLTVAYDQLVAVDGIDMAVPAGSVVALLGPNGAGKSTLLKAVSGLVPARAGRVVVDGEDVTGLTAHERAHRGVCLIPEGRGVFPALTVADNLRVALGDDPAASARVLEFFPVLADRRSQLAGTLSGGEQQMLALARAVGTEPALLMADELSLGLAPLLVHTLNQALRRLHEEQGRTILLVEQYATHALDLADFVVILARGRVAWGGEPAELRASKVLAETYLGSAAQTAPRPRSPASRRRAISATSSGTESRNHLPPTRS